MPPPLIRQAVPDDAAGIVSVLEVIASERVHSAIDRVWSVAEEASYLQSLSPREAFQVATDGNQRVIGFQSLDRWSAFLGSMAHVGQVGTFLLPASRGKGIGRMLWASTERFARDAGYRKLVIQVRASNIAAQAFYMRLGFQECGRLREQVIIDGVPEDELLMEYFLR